MRRTRLPRRAIALALATAVAAGTLAVATSGSAAAGAGAATSSAGHAGRGERFVHTRQVTMNVRFGMRPRRQRQDIRRATDRADVIGWQEINRVAQTRAIQGLRGWSTYWPGGTRPDGDAWRNAENTNPISWRRRAWRLDRGSTWLASREIEDVTRERYLTFVVLEHRRSGEKIVRWNVHFVPNAWNSTRVRHKAARRTEWRRAARRTRVFVDRATGWGHAAVLGGGDINWRSRFVGDRVAYDTDHQRIDYLTHVPGALVVAGEPEFREANSDHDRVRVGYSLYR